MAFLDHDAGLPLWLPQPVPEDALTGSSIQLVMEESPPEAPSGPTGYIIRNWFGPFLLASPSRLLRGRC